MKLFFLLTCLLCFCGGCASSVYYASESDRLTPEEQNAVVDHIRTFIRRSRLRVTPAEKAYIMNHAPKFLVDYTGYKEGALSVCWQLPRGKNLIVNRTGKLLSNERADWSMRLIVDKSSQLLPEGFYGSQGEELALPPL